ncbi:MAG: histone deacetylase family protein [Proteobacteria bacterium]|nr:histone deacetylase family protein [Pseudomonadota bacterium]
MLLYTHPACLQHDPGAGHPECPPRLAHVLDALNDAFPALAWQTAPSAERGQLARVHAPAHIAGILDTPVHGHLRIDPDTLLSEASAEAALRAAGAGIAAVDAVVSGAATRAFCAVRPPGHHATHDAAMGFCLFNSVAVAAAHALAAHGLPRVAIADFDVHHGNGTQDIFAGDARVLYLSSHQSPLYPGTGAASEHGVGNIHNIPLRPGAGGAALREAWGEHLLPVLDAFAPQLVLVSAGFDAHRLDPLAQLEAETEDFGWLTARLRQLAERHAEGRLVSLLEGGYNMQALRECAVAHVAALAD